MDKLPPEILLQILEQDPLPASSILALRQTCRRFRDTYDNPDFGTLASIHEDSGEKLDFLEMLGRDSPITDLLACPACLVLHPPSKYCQSERMKPPSQRQCLHRSKLLICPHLYFSFRQWQDFVAKPSHCDPDSRRGCRQCDPYMPSKLYHEGPERALGQRIDLGLMILEPRSAIETKCIVRQAFPASLVRELLGKLSMSACSHIQVSDKWVSQLYDPKNLELKGIGWAPKWLAMARKAWPWSQALKQGTQARPWRCPERDCKTIFWFEVRRISRLRLDTIYFLMLMLCIKRSMGVLTDMTSTAWSDHVVTEAEQEATLTSWDSSTLILKQQWRDARWRR